MSAASAFADTDGHEHARCRYCNHPAVHVIPARLDGAVKYAHHSINGGTDNCLASHNRIVWTEDRHQPAPEAAP